MNQRINELKRAAGIDHNPDQEGLDLFADLIVKECVDQLRQEWYNLNNDENNVLGDARATAILVGQKNGVLKSISRIKKYFGVEE